MLDDMRKRLLTEYGVEASELPCDTDELTPTAKPPSTYGRSYPKPKPGLRQVKPATEKPSGESWWLHASQDGFTAEAERRQLEMSGGPAADKVSKKNFVGFSGTGE